MESIWDIYESKSWVEPFLIYAICFLITASFILFLSLIYIRYNKIKVARLKSEYNLLIEKILLTVLFTDDNYATVIQDREVSAIIKNKLFRNQLMLSVINLHQNYEGIYAKKLEEFYFESRLITDSFKKLSSSKWEVQCAAIEQLSEMKTVKAFNSLVKISKTKNKTLKIAAIQGCIKLNGTKGLTHLIHHQDPIDHWAQLNIISTLQQGDIEHTDGVELLLSSPNKTVASLGLKIIQTLNLSQNEFEIMDLIGNTQSKSLKKEAQEVMGVIQSTIPSDRLQ